MMTLGWLIAANLVGATSAAPGGSHRFVKNVDGARLQDELLAAGFKVQDIQCSRAAGQAMSCEIRWGMGGESKDPRKIIDAHIYESPEDRGTRRAAERAALKALAAKWKAGTITPAEKDDLIQRFIMLHLEQGQP